MQHFKQSTVLALGVSARLMTAAAFAGSPAKDVAPPAPSDSWEFTLAIPGWFPGLDGDTGVNGLNSHVELDPGDVFRHYDLAAVLRAEARKGRFGVSTDILYTSLSDGIGTDTILQKMDIQVDQTIAELAVSWRVIDHPRGTLDLVAGVRYMNLFQQVVTQPNDEQIETSVEEFGDEFGARVRERVDEALSEEKFRNALTEAVKQRLNVAAADYTGPEPVEQQTPVAPLAAHHFRRSDRELTNLVQRRARQVVRATAADARAAVQAEATAVRAVTAEARAAAQQLARELRERVNLRVAKAKSNLEKELEKKMHDALDHRVARTDDWWDPFIGVRARYNFNDRFYATLRGDIGGFGVGSDLAWQAEGALGWQMTPHIFAELGYRAFAVDYEKDGLLYDVVMNGAQLTMGITF